jgi:hypothetical protein
VPLDKTRVEFDEDKIDRIVSDVRDEAHLNARRAILVRRTHSMTYVIIALLVVMLIAIAPFVRRHFRGQRLISSILSGKFDEWPPGQPFAAWFKERPEREEQRKLFVDLALAFRCPRGVIDLSPTASRS